MIALLVFCSVLVGCLGFLLGSAMSYNRGYGDGWDDAEDFHALEDDVADIRWALTATGKREEDARCAGFNAPSILNDGPVS